MSPNDFLDALISLPKLGSSSVSPDGRWAAWSWYGVGPTADVYAAPTDASAAPLRLTETEENAELVSWTPDSRAVLVGQDHDGDERVQLFRVDLDRPRALRPLTEAAPGYFLRGGQLHPNGRWLVYAMNFDVESGREIEPTWIYRHDLITGERRPLARPLKGGYYEPQLNDAGTHILYSRQDLDPAGSQVWLVDVEGRDDREILNAGPSAKVFASWFPDGRRVLFLAESGAYRRLGVWQLGDGAVRWLLDDPSRNVEWAFVPRGGTGSTAVVAEVREARTCASLLDVETGREAPLPDLPG
ncbi:MAG: PD40 domain-containing protein, partial [Chloroflexi bacterium]|nr:PD40 domain-containing protein [Chloroflexota bacterium]